MELISLKRVLTVLALSASLSVFAQTDAVTQVSTSAMSLDLTLDKAIEIALADNPTIKVADKDIEIKKIADKEAWMNLLPTLDGSLSLQHSIKVAAIRTKMPGSDQVVEFKMGMDGSTTAVGGVTLALPVFAPAIYKNIQMTKDDILLAQEAARGSRLDLIRQVQKAYYNVLMAMDSYEVVKKSYDLAAENYRLIDARYQVGKASEYEQLSASVQMRSMNSTMVSTETGVKLAKLQLAVLMGISGEVNLNVLDNLRSYESSMKVEDPYSAMLELDNNSSLRQLDYSQKLVQRSIGILKTNFMPTIGLQLTGQYQSMSNDNWNLFKYHYSPSMTLAVAVQVPLFKASNFTKLKTARLQLQELQDNRENVVNQLRMAVQSYRSSMNSTLDQIESNRLAVTQAQKALEIMMKRYEVGMGTVLELNQTETALTQAELTYTQSLFDYLSSKADLDYTLGREGNYIK